MQITNGLTPRLAEIGKIKIGGKGAEKTSKSGSKYRMPVRYDHFKVTTTEKDATGNFIVDKNIMLALGEKPTEIPIRLAFDSIEMNFRTCFEYYAGKKCICRGDGDKAKRTGDSGKSREIECKNQECEFLKSGKCKVSGILSCFIFAGNNDLGGVHRFRTHGWNSVSNILASLQFFADNTGGILQGLPLKLKMIKKQTEEHGVVNVVTVVMDGVEMNNLRQMAVAEKQNRQLLNIDIKQIEQQAVDAGFTVINDDDADVQEEFFPEPKEPRTVSPTEIMDAVLDLPDAKDAPDYKPEPADTGDHAKEEKDGKKYSDIDIF